MGRDGRKMLLPHPTNRLVDWQRNMPVVCPVCEGIPESEGGRRMEVPWQNGRRPIKSVGGLDRYRDVCPLFGGRCADAARPGLSGDDRYEPVAPVLWGGLEERALLRFIDPV